MYVIQAHNVNDALPKGLEVLRRHGFWQRTRNGNAIVCPQPVTTRYVAPKERVLFWRERDANPFFHLFEALWMLGGRNDLKYVANFVKRMREYSDDGATLWGAYGWRWRSFFDFDQLEWAVDRLKKDPADRRVVINMFAPGNDQVKADDGGKDIPCNLAVHFQVILGKLNMTVFNRSNDIVWGGYGANVVHMSILQEYISGMIGVPVGRYWQVSDNFHAYEEIYTKLLAVQGTPTDHYLNEEAVPFNLVLQAGSFDQDLAMFLEEPHAIGFRNPFFRKIAKPLYFAHQAYKQKTMAELEILEQMPSKNDWRLAAEQWIMRKHANAG